MKTTSLHTTEFPGFPELETLTGTVPQWTHAHVRLPDRLTQRPRLTQPTGVLSLMLFLCAFSAHAGTITKFAGTGTASFSGDGGAATSAALQYPMGIAIDSSNNTSDRF